MDLYAVVAAIPALAPYAVYVAAVCGTAAAVARYLPPPAQDGFKAYRIAYVVINWLGRNRGYAANAVTPPK